MSEAIKTEKIEIKNDSITLQGRVYLSERPKSWIVFAHGSGSSHSSTRNIAVAKELAEAGHSTLLFDLLTLDEDYHFANRFDISLLTKRLILATHWLMGSKYYINGTPIGFFGASTGAAAALTAAATDPLIKEYNYALISRGGRPDLASKKILSELNIPILLIVGGKDFDVIKLNQTAAQYLGNCQIVLVPNATHLFEESGAMTEVTQLAKKWFNLHLPKVIHREESMKFF